MGPINALGPRATGRGQHGHSAPTKRTCLFVLGSVHDAVGALLNPVQTLELLHTPAALGEAPDSGPGPRLAPVLPQDRAARGPTCRAGRYLGSSGLSSSGDRAGESGTQSPSVRALLRGVPSPTSFSPSSLPPESRSKRDSGTFRVKPWDARRGPRLGQQPGPRPPTHQPARGSRSPPHHSSPRSLPLRDGRCVSGRGVLPTTTQGCPLSRAIRRPPTCRLL